MDHFSYAKLSTYQKCPYSYKLYYIDKWRAIKESANRKFGKAIHKAMEEFLVNGAMPSETFSEVWAEFKDVDLDYSTRDTWDSLNSSGIALMELFEKEHMSRFGKVYLVENQFFVPFIHNIPLKGYIDCVVDIDGIPTLIDFKTSSRSYTDTQVKLNDQLTLYAMITKNMDVNIQKVAYLTFIRTKTPKIEWYFDERTEEQIKKLINKSQYVFEDIMRERFEQRFGQHCTWCDYLPICSENTQEINEKLTRMTEDSLNDEFGEEDE